MNNDRPRRTALTVVAVMSAAAALVAVGVLSCRCLAGELACVSMARGIV
jgi:hypothetical protein